MKTVSGKITSTRPVSLHTASKVLAKFITVDNGASPAISIYLRKASEAFDELTQFHKGLRMPKSGRKSRKPSTLAESVDSPPGEIKPEDVESDQRKLRQMKKKAADGDDGENGVIEANEDSKGIVEQELGNGDGKFVGSEGEEKKHRSKVNKSKGGVSDAVQSIVENGGELNGKEEEEDGKRKKKKKDKKKKGGDVTVSIEETDRGKKRKLEESGDGRDEDGSMDRRSKKKKRR